MLLATTVKCPSAEEGGAYEHTRRDHCTTCAPFWENIAVCEQGHKLKPSEHDGLYRPGHEKGFCTKCRKFYLLP